MSVEHQEDDAASYSRYSSDPQGEKSNDQQEQKQDAAAAKNGHKLRPELRFRDGAISGTKRDREGLNNMLKAAEEGKFKTLYLYSLSRLARESIITLPILKRLVYVHKIRVITVMDGIDSNTPHWYMMASFLAIFAENFISELGANVFRGHEDNIRNNYSVGDFCFGYTSVPCPNYSPTRHGTRTPRVYAINLATAHWVKQIFIWFVVDHKSITWIVRKLNKHKVPVGAHGSTSHWEHEYVTRLLRRTKYIGIWPWGKTRTVRDPETGKITKEHRSEEELLKWLRYFPDLCLIELEIFQKAQEFLDELALKAGAIKGADGKFKGSKRDRNDLSPKHLLSQLLKCAECGSTWHVSGPYGKYFQCPGYLRGTCTCRTTLQRARADRMLLETIAYYMLSNDSWINDVFAKSLTAVKRDNGQLPNEEAVARKRLGEINKLIQNAVDALEQGGEIPELKKRIGERRAEKKKLEQQLEKLDARQREIDQPLTREMLVAELRQLHDLIVGGQPAANHALKHLLSGGMVLEQVIPPGKKRGFIRGTFQLQVTIGSEVCTHGKPITIEFEDRAERLKREQQVLAMLEQGFLYKEIQEKLNMAETAFGNIMRSLEAKGTVKYDGHARRFELRRQQQPPRMHERIADEVKTLMDQGLLLGEIADMLHCDKATVTAAKKHWYKSHGLQIPDGRTRRKLLDHKQRDVKPDKNVEPPRTEGGQTTSGDAKPDVGDATDGQQAA